MENTNNKDKLIQLMDEYQNLVFSICLKMTGDYFLAEDLSQETFLSAYKALDSFDGQNEKSWLARIATNKCLDYLRSPKSKETAQEELPDQKDTEETCKLVETKVVLEDLVNQMKKLGPPYSEVLYKNLIENKTAKEIAEEQKQPLKTVQTQIYRGKAKLKKTYGKEMLEE